VTLARFGNGAETGHHSSRSGGSGRIYTEQAAYDLTF
jgi:hypothetical protein